MEDAGFEQVEVAEPVDAVGGAPGEANAPLVRGVRPPLHRPQTEAVSSAARTVTSEDLRATMQHCRTRLDEVADRDWNVPVPGLDWTVRTTAEHLADVLGFYTLHLASGTPRRLRIDVRCHKELPNADVVVTLDELSRGLAALAAGTAPHVRAFHFHGTADASGFLALACAELLVHTHDILRGLDATLAPHPKIAGRVRARLFPQAPHETPPWRTLLWATGRGTLPGHPDVADDWVYHPTPPEEHRAP